jgi:hypothetical protein
MRLLLGNHPIRSKRFCEKSVVFPASGDLLTRTTEKIPVFLRHAVDSVHFCGTLLSLSQNRGKALATVALHLARFLL